MSFWISQVSQLVRIACGPIYALSTFTVCVPWVTRSVFVIYLAWLCRYSITSALESKFL